MSLIIATGSNIGDRIKNLNLALEELNKYFSLIKASDIFQSPAVDYLNQPDFLNQVIEFKLPNYSALEVLEIVLKIELKFGRTRLIDKGPRSIDIDIIFWDLERIDIEKKLHVPHPSWNERSFVVRPLMQLPFFQTLEKHFTIPNTFKVEAIPIVK